MSTAPKSAGLSWRELLRTTWREAAKTNIANRAAELHAGRTQWTRLLDLEDLPWYGKAHGSSPHRQYNTGRYRHP